MGDSRHSADLLMETDGLSSGVWCLPPHTHIEDEVTNTTGILDTGAPLWKVFFVFSRCVYEPPRELFFSWDSHPAPVPLQGHGINSQMFISLS